jgi:hypothetical protein
MLPFDFSECLRDEEGNLLDQITYDPVPEDRAVLLDGACTDIETLLVNAVLNGDITNPFNRQPLPEEIITRMEKVRESKEIKVSIINPGREPFSEGRRINFFADYFSCVGDLIVQATARTSSFVNAGKMDYCWSFSDESLSSLFPWTGGRTRWWSTELSALFPPGLTSGPKPLSWSSSGRPRDIRSFSLSSIHNPLQNTKTS